ncbi:hypothetical protein BVC93_30205 [Mycobacterium sp. MS1601]|uniref:PE-PPE domain-containing protein n=1 Tax=Mycobacterium sp. MS1601 TaxID=1936029 RepID=UPI00097966E9|nr:PE-PPE domain-containing protein [Mycobacterium sp. MS1601]AQA05929.1 hypothetical protein BVC93_30205 [Mycobacterium sp. MS1601]
MAGPKRKRSHKVRRIAKTGAITAVATGLLCSTGPGTAAAGTATIPVGDYGSVELPVSTFATGWPFWFADTLGIMPELPDEIGRLGYLSSWNSRDFYNAITGISTDAVIDLDSTFHGVHISDRVDVMARAALVASFGSSSYAAMAAYRSLADAVLGAPLPGDYTPIESAPGRDDIPFKNIAAGDLTAAMYQDPALPNTLALVLALIRDPGTPNGGLAARFSGLPSLLGIHTVTPDVSMIVPDGFDLSDPYSVEMRQTQSRVCVPILGCSTVTYDVPAAVSNWDGGKMLLPLKFTLNWEYDTVSDFPATLNPVSLANSLMAGLLPSYIVRGLDTAALAEQLADQLGISTDAIVDALTGADPDSPEVTAAINNYLTVRASSLPLLEPLRLPFDLINTVLGTNLRNPVADALEPALKILVNIGYTDVVTPADIAANPQLSVYGEYGRTLDTMGEHIQFMSTSPLTVDEYLRVPGDVLTALLTGIKNVLVGATSASDGVVPSTPTEPEPDTENTTRAKNVITAAPYEQTQPADRSVDSTEQPATTESTADESESLGSDESDDVSSTTKTRPSSRTSARLALDGLSVRDSHTDRQDPSDDNSSCPPDSADAGEENDTKVSGESGDSGDADKSETKVTTAAE